jgi:hypothetical protein
MSNREKMKGRPPDPATKLYSATKLAIGRFPVLHRFAPASVNTGPDHKTIRWSLLFWMKYSSEILADVISSCQGRVSVLSVNLGQVNSQ